MSETPYDGLRDSPPCGTRSDETDEKSWSDIIRAYPIKGTVALILLSPFLTIVAWTHPDAAPWDGRLVFTGLTLTVYGGGSVAFVVYWPALERLGSRAWSALVAAVPAVVWTPADVLLVVVAVGGLLTVAGLLLHWRGGARA